MPLTAIDPIDPCHHQCDSMHQARQQTAESTDCRLNAKSIEGSPHRGLIGGDYWATRFVLKCLGGFHRTPSGAGAKKHIGLW